MLLRYKWMILLAAGLGIIAAWGIRSTITPSYSVNTLVQVSSPQPGGGSGVTAIEAREARQPGDWQNLLLSFSVLEPVAKELGLFVGAEKPEHASFFRDARMTGDLRPGEYRLLVDERGESYRIVDRSDLEVEAGPISDNIGHELGISLAGAEQLPPGLDAPFRVSRLRDSARGLAESLQVETTASAYMAIRTAAADSEVAATRANAVTESFIREAEALARARSSELSETLEQQLASARASLAEAEAELEAFLSQTALAPRGDTDGGGESSARAAYSALRAELEELERDRASIERAVAPARDGDPVRVQALEQIAVVLASSEVSGLLDELSELRAERRALLQRYTEDYPPVIELQSDIRDLETSLIPAAAEELLTELNRRAEDLESRVSAREAELGAVPARAITEASLRREVERAGAIYEDVSDRHSSARLAALSSTSDVRVVDWAEPPSQPDADRGLIFSAAAFMGFLGMGLAGALLMDRLDRRVRTPAEVEDQLGLDILGVLPHLKNVRGRLKAGEHDQAVEAFRSIRTGLMYAHGAAGPLVVAISSPQPGDGKSFTVSNLALSFAELGRRTVVVDGDVRRGVQHTLLSVERKPGLTDFLAGRADLEQVVRDTSHTKLSVIPLGTRLDSAPELLSTTPMQELMGELKADFDVIIVDTSPLGAAADALLLSSLAGNLAMVVRSGKTDLEHAEAMLRNLRRFPVRVLGTIVNDVKADAGYRYYGYLPGYGVEDPEELEPPRQPAALPG